MNIAVHSIPDFEPVKEFRVGFWIRGPSVSPHTREMANWREMRVDLAMLGDINTRQARIHQTAVIIGQAKLQDISKKIMSLH
jgi:hypothetical protein